jgi:hypothetical protein
MEFPLLDTAVHVQYGAAKERQIRHKAHEFLGDGRQSQIDRVTSGLRWSLTYAELNANEAYRLRAFCEGLIFGETFAFTDPWTGEVFANCRLAGSSFSMVAGASLRYRVELEVEDAE